MFACYPIPVENFYKFDAKMKALTRKAKKLGLAAFTWDIVHSGFFHNGTVHYWVEIYGTAPYIPGHEFLGVIEYMSDDNGNRLYLFNAARPGVEVPSSFWKNPTHDCDHCHTKRQRVKMYILRAGETGEIIQVGSNCLQDFLRDENSISRIAEYSRLVHKMGTVAEECYELSGRYYDQAHPLTHWLVPAAAAVRLFGWVSKAKENENETLTSTVRVVSSHLNALKKKDRLNIEEVDHETAKKAVKWISEQNVDGDEYLEKLRDIVEFKACNTRNAGLLISLISAYQRSLAEVSKFGPKSDVIEGRQTINGIVLSIRKQENFKIGFTWKMLVMDGRGFKLWGTVPKSVTPEIGDSVEFTATVTKSDKDSSFGFFSRPTKAAIIEEVKSND